MIRLFVTFLCWFAVIGAVVCLTNILALRQSRDRSRFRLCYETVSIVLGTALILQICCNVLGHDVTTVTILASFPIPYWIMVWFRARHFRSMLGSGCLLSIGAFLFCAISGEMLTYFFGALTPSHADLVSLLFILDLYTPLWVGFGSRLHGIFRQSQTTETGSDEEECGQSADAVQTQNAPPKEND